MAANAGLAIVMLLETGYTWEHLYSTLDGSHIEASLPGRTQLVSGTEGPAVYVDFGHSPDAFEKTLAAVRRVTPGKVVMVFGADGDRDATKRHDMGRTAVEGSDILVVTDHHPRHENPDTIREVLLHATVYAGAPAGNAAFAVARRVLAELGLDPRSANYAPQPAEADLSALPLAGKTFVLTGTLTIDRDEMRRLLEAKGAKVSGSVSAKTHFVVAGEGGGSKRDKAEKLGVPVIDESEARRMME